jgi:hypothetical protein
MTDFNYYLQRAYNEEVPSDGQSIKYYAFDWDDNIQSLPTTINLKSPDEEIVERVSTEEFAHKRNDPIILEKLKQGYEWDYSAFRNDEQFFIDEAKSSIGPAWDDFVECVNNASIFAIITARGHSPEAYKKVITKMINTNQNGISKQSVIDNIKKYRMASGQNVRLSDDQIIQKYVNMCKYYPVNYPPVKEALGGEGGVDSPEKLKTTALSHFVQFVNKMSGVLQNKIGKREIKVGFSDDDKKNYETMKKYVQDSGMDNITVKYTGK